MVKARNVGVLVAAGAVGILLGLAVFRLLGWDRPQPAEVLYERPAEAQAPTPAIPGQLTQEQQAAQLQLNLKTTKARVQPPPAAQQPPPPTAPAKKRTGELLPGQRPPKKTGAH